jgi:cytidylate kinase
MKKQCDFSKAVRGKFYKSNLVLSIPIYLDAKLQKRVEEIARRKGQDVGALVRRIVRKELELLADMAN